MRCFGKSPALSGLGSRRQPLCHGWTGDPLALGPALLSPRRPLVSNARSPGAPVGPLPSQAETDGRAGGGRVWTTAFNGNLFATAARAQQHRAHTARRTRTHTPGERVGGGGGPPGSGGRGGGGGSWLRRDDTGGRTPEGSYMNLLSLHVIVLRAFPGAAGMSLPGQDGGDCPGWDMLGNPLPYTGSSQDCTREGEAWAQTGLEAREITWECLSEQDGLGGSGTQPPQSRAEIFRGRAQQDLGASSIPEEERPSWGRRGKGREKDSRTISGTNSPKAGAPRCG